MTKTLTEQWKNGELASGWYFYKTKLGGIVIGFQFYGLKYPYNACHQTIDNVKEVLAPVPSYKEYNKLRKLPLKCFELEEDNSALMVLNKDMCKEKERIEKKLAIATKALKDIRGWDEYDCMGLAKKALKEMEGVK